MSKGCYTITALPNGSDLSFGIRQDLDGPIPDDQQALAIEIANVFSNIQLLYPTDSLEFKRCFDQLKGIAKIGLETDPAQPILAGKALTQFKSEVVAREGGKRKNSYLKELGTTAVIAGLPLFVGGTTINLITFSVELCRCVAWNYIANMAILISGTMVGVWLSFAITRTELGFDDLAVIEKDRLEPTIA